MDKTEFSKFCKVMKTAYIKEDKLFSSEENVELWFRMLKDLDYQTAMTALEIWIAENKWSPSISEIRETVVRIFEDKNDWFDAWEQVIKSIGRYGIYQQKEALESLPELARETVKKIGYGTICLSENISVERASFRQIYESLQKRKAEEIRLPEKLNEKLRLIHGRAEQKQLKETFTVSLQDYRKTDHQEKQYDDGHEQKDWESAPDSVQAVSEIRKKLSQQLGFDV